MQEFRAGIDVGSTTVKLVLLNEKDEIVFGEYRRHHAQTQETLAQLFSAVKDRFGECSLRCRITGSGAIGLSRALSIPFMQEVMAVAGAVSHTAPQTDVAIELGGEDAKIIYFRGGLEERMNGICAGGTGAFIDQMAALLQTDAAGLNEAAKNYKQIYPIAARCGVFAKSDIQPLINEGASTADLAASIFNAVVSQTVSGLACGKPVRGCVAFLGGPLHFLSELKASFVRTLKLTPDNIVDPENSHLYAAMGAALGAETVEPVSVDDLLKMLKNGVALELTLKRLPPLFENGEEYSRFLNRHAAAVVPKGNLADYSGKCFLGIDAGSTTTKVALVGSNGELLFSFYDNNHGDPVETAKRAFAQLKTEMPGTAEIARSCSTGYGEELLKSAFMLDEGEVETIAHCTAASFFDPSVDCVLDIGGQDMKCVKLKNGSVDSVLLNEACSSGCGSFLENFANSLGLSSEEFAKKALFAKEPVDLGTRCTVFMNSNVKQAQKEGVDVADISAGLAYSVIKNALFKVIKLTDAKNLGSHVVVQGGTFYNHAVLRAFEKIAGVEAVCPDISGIMGAFGAALIAKNRYHGQPTTTLSLDEMINITHTTRAARCGGCANNCMLTVNIFPNGRRHITGNRCEKGAGGNTPAKKGGNLFEYKRKRIFDYEPLAESDAPRGVIGIPRVLNMYENYPYWATFFKELGFRVVLSPFATREIYTLGMESIPSESECYPAKLAHGHVQWLINNGIRTVFHPSVFYEYKENANAQNNYNCPIVTAYPENIKNNVESISENGVRYIKPFISFADEKTAERRLVSLCREEWNIPAAEVRKAAASAWREQRRAKDDIRAEGKRELENIERSGAKGIVLAGRPYHIDPEINHGIPEMIASYGVTVFTEDSLPDDFSDEHPLRVVDQWVYHSRLYRAAEFVRSRADLELIQLNSFGCGLDAVTSDQVREILEGSNRLYTILKIDEVNNLGAARIRVRSLLAAMRIRDEQNIKPDPHSAVYHRTEFTMEMKKSGYTIIAPQMSPIHFNILCPVLRKYGFNFVILQNDSRTAIETGLKFVNNDACFPSITIVGQIMEAVTSGEYDTDRLAILMTQTGGCCRASNYVSFIRRALDKVGLSKIPVISLNVNGMEKNSGFKIPVPALLGALRAVVVGDLFMRCLYRVRPYEKVKGSANALHDKWSKIAINVLTKADKRYSFGELCENIVSEFDSLPIYEDLKKPRIGIVGEILVKYMPLANNHLVDLLESENAEVIVPDLLDFLNYSLYNSDYKHRYLGKGLGGVIISRLGIKGLGILRSPAIKALKKSKRFSAPAPISELAEAAEPFLALGNQYGEGWFLTGEMSHMLQNGADGIICTQPFGCLPNHVVGKGVIKAMKKAYPQANIVAVDYDPGASEVNQLNRIKLLLAAAGATGKKAERQSAS